MKQEIYKDVYSLDSKARLLKRIVDIRKLLLSSGAYSLHNMEVQDRNFERLNVPQWEKDIIRKSWDATRILAKELLTELDILSNKILNDNKDIKKNNKDIIKQILREKHKGCVIN